MGITLRADGASTSKDVLRSFPRSLEELEQLLNDGEIKDVPKIIGICGLRDLPAIAMSIYKNFGPSFDGNCFLKHARKPRKSTDVNNKENQVISDLVPTDKSTGKEALLVRGKKALIILDDARHLKELDMLKELQLGPDSLIVILAKKRKLLRDMRVDCTIEAGVDGLKISSETITKATAAATVDELPVEDHNMKDGSSESLLMGSLEIESQEDRLVHSTPSGIPNVEGQILRQTNVHQRLSGSRCCIKVPKGFMLIVCGLGIEAASLAFEQMELDLPGMIAAYMGFLVVVIDMVLSLPMFYRSLALNPPHRTFSAIDYFELAAASWQSIHSTVPLEGWALLISVSIIEVASLVFAQTNGTRLTGHGNGYLALALCLTGMALALQWCCSSRPRRTFGNVLDYFGLHSFHDGVHLLPAWLEESDRNRPKLDHPFPLFVGCEIRQSAALAKPEGLFPSMGSNELSKWLIPIITVALAAFSTSAAISLDRCRKKSEELESKVEELELSLKSSVEKSAAERQGRIRAQQTLRKALAEQKSENMQHSSYPMVPIGTVQSCFSTRNGTPRQPLVVPLARASLMFDPSRVPPASLEGLTEYSHCWIIYVFHLNTDLEKLWKEPSRSKFKAKVRVPRLKGGRMGVFATRTPHRPCPIGLTVAKPVLDIKPYLPYCDCISEASVPKWVMEDDMLAVASVSFSADFASSLDDCWSRIGKKSLYASAEELQCLIKQVLSWDIRSVSQRNQPHNAEGHNPDEDSNVHNDDQEDDESRSDSTDIIYHLVLEGVDFAYRIDESGNVVVDKASVVVNSSSNIPNGELRDRARLFRPS
ncbi:tRNA (adenine(37)-N6)-methyltransferase [Linum grandiflorum]